ncbi:MAG: CoA transferase [Acidimicrobiia bacterium]
MSGPLDGVRVVEIVGLGPGPFCAMLLADLGAEVVRIDRPAAVRPDLAVMPATDVLARGRRSVAVDLKRPEGAELLLHLLEQADVLVEGFRPGVMERLGLGPDICLARNPRLVYGRMTGFGQDGPLAQAAGHDINYIALAGVLAHIGRAGEKPVPPLNLVGDFGGGGMLLAFGVCAALVERGRSGRGQVVDAAMVDGAATLMAVFHGMRADGSWGERGTNWIDTGAHFYDTYETSDGRYVAIGAVEPQFYAELLRRIGLDGEDLPRQLDPAGWPEMKRRLTEVFAGRTLDEWCALLEGTDVCFAPVLAMDEAYRHPHNVARRTFVEVDGVLQPAPSPRFARTPGAIQGPPARPGQHTQVVLADWGVTVDEIERLRAQGVVS